MDVNTSSTVPENKTNLTFNEHTTPITGDLHPEIQMNMVVAEKMHWVTSIIFGSIFVCMGLIGNTLSILVWNRKSLRCSTGTYLIAQAVSNMGLLVFFFATDALIMMEPSIKKNFAYGVFYSYVGYPLFFLFVVCSIWLTVGVTIDRYIQVCWIVQAKTLSNTKSALTGIGVISLLCFMINTPHFNTYRPVSNEEKDEDEPAFVHTEFGKGEVSEKYEFWVHCMFLVLVPWVTIFILNMLILHKVYQTNAKMMSIRSWEGKEKARRAENQLTKLLLIVTFTFLVLNALQCVTQCFFMLQPESADLRIVNESFAIAKLGLVINASISFVLYCLSGREFRKELGRICGKKDEGHLSYIVGDSTCETGCSKTPPKTPPKTPTTARKSQAQEEPSLQTTD